MPQTSWHRRTLSGKLMRHLVKKAAPVLLALLAAAATMAPGPPDEKQPPESPPSAGWPEGKVELETSSRAPRHDGHVSTVNPWLTGVCGVADHSQTPTAQREMDPSKGPVLHLRPLRPMVWPAQIKPDNPASLHPGIMRTLRSLLPWAWPVNAAPEDPSLRLAP